MASIIPAAVSLFGAPLGAVPILNSVTDSDTSLMAGLTTSFLSSSSTAAGAAASGFGVTGISGTSPAPFADLVTEAVGQVEHLEQQAQASIEGLMSGKGVDVHEAMIATQKAGMSFELLLSVRNKALAAYQQVMGMQF
jgi:flagellar hook-basal body complex protein FliE